MDNAKRKGPDFSGPFKLSRTSLDYFMVPEAGSNRHGIAPAGF